jgi:NAD(P)-dependent dehydrogenase (short-subunit alcohol dehydrogenase family)
MTAHAPGRLGVLLRRPLRILTALRRPDPVPYPVSVAIPGVVLGKSTVVITGAAGLLGQALIRALGDSGADVWGLDPQPVPGVDAGRDLRCDVTVPGEVDAAAAAIVATHPPGAPLLLFHFAGYEEEGFRGVEAPPEVWAQTYALYVVGPIQLIGRLLPAMAVGSGIVFVSSVRAQTPCPVPHYGASKAAVEKAVQDLAIEFAPRGIRVNAVAPSHTTAAGTVRPSPYSPLYGGANVPVEAVVHACLFLADPQTSPATTGITLRVDGARAFDTALLRDLRPG